MEAYDGPQIVGMDLHRRRSVLVRMAEDGGAAGLLIDPAARAGQPHAPRPPAAGHPEG